MQLPSYVWQLQSTNDNGPNVLVLGGTHGDELPGILAVRQMLHAFGLLQKPNGNYPNPHITGNLFLGFGNPQAIVRCTRGVTQRDLNRSFAPEILDDPTVVQNGQVDAERAQELEPLLQNMDYLLDLHATSGASDPFVAFGNDSERHRDLYTLMPVQHVLTDPNTILPTMQNISALGTTDYYVNTFGGSRWSIDKFGKNATGVGLCYEAGNQDDASLTALTISVVLKLLEHIGVVNSEFGDKVLPTRVDYVVPQQKRYSLKACIGAKRTKFTYADGMQTNWRPVRKGEILGNYDDGSPEIIAQDGLLVFPKRADKIKEGLSLYLLAEELA
ncbi:succinylglutamate desuccinylase/aspartoacylase family protein [Patescibacteria group bacterium]|nr:succinylglutamate desuccinylase/aspartoacylase family protein [Patescibacteria group bacterium]